MLPAVKRRFSWLLLLASACAQEPKAEVRPLLMPPGFTLGPYPSALRIAIDRIIAHCASLDSRVTYHDADWRAQTLQATAELLFAMPVASAPKPSRQVKYETSV